MTYYAREHTDPAGGALTITTDHQGAWITATEGRDEVTVGPFLVAVLELAGSYTRTTEQPHPLTADDITDEMVGRVRDRMHERGMGFLSSYSIRELLIVALTEPPTRPEGAEEIERLLTENLGDFRPPVEPEAIADLLASRGVRAPEEQP